MDCNFETFFHFGQWTYEPLNELLIVVFPPMEKVNSRWAWTVKFGLPTL